MLSPWIHLSQPHVPSAPVPECASYSAGRWGVVMNTTYPVPAFTEPAGYGINQIIVGLINQYRLDLVAPPVPESPLILCCWGIKSRLLSMV